MTNNTKIIIALVAVLLIAGGIYLGIKNKGSVAPQIQEQTQEQAATDKALDPISGQTVSDSIPKTNPFETQVNPYDSYKNPFN